MDLGKYFILKALIKYDLSFNKLKYNTLEKYTFPKIQTQQINYVPPILGHLVSIKNNIGCVCLCVSVYVYSIIKWRNSLQAMCTEHSKPF